eukprot:snap_masked-scaffold_18-processed-gene-6.54-mRNA-1 protein AED:0.21 eAED:0.24 QI:0/-1/0/1/-1/1/1/0/342
MKENNFSLRKVGSPLSPPKVFTEIKLQKLDDNLFLAPKEALWRPSQARSVYGGQVIGQAIAAASATVPFEKKLHSTHCYFLRGGKIDSNIIYIVLKLRDGYSFSSRLVIAQQNSEPIFIQTNSFQKEEFSSLKLHHIMPIVPLPETCISASEYFTFLAEKDPRTEGPIKQYFEANAIEEKKSPMEFRFIQVSDLLSKYASKDSKIYKDMLKLRPPGFPKYTTEPKRQVWFRIKHVLRADDLEATTQKAILAYVSDMFLLGTAASGDNINMTSVSMIATRDHSMWFHSDVQLNEWCLYETEAVRTANGRALCFGKVFRQDGTLAVTVAQEGVLRLREDTLGKL